MFLVVEEQDSTCPGLNCLALKHMTCYTQYFAIEGTLAKTFASVSNEISPILITRFLRKKR